MTDKFTVEYDDFEEDGVVVLTTSKGDEAIWMFHGNEAEAIYRLLTGDPKAIQAARFGLLLDIPSK